MIKIPELTANDRWQALARQVWVFGKEAQPRGQKTKEMLGLVTEVPMTRPILTIETRKLGYRFMAAEAWWILSGSNRVDLIEPFSKRITDFSDDGQTFFGAYGPPVVDQLGYVVDTLIRDQDSRQAVLTIWRQRPGPTKDVPCTVSLQFMIRPDKEWNLHLHVFANMRSSDVWLGVPYDWFNFSMIGLFVAAMYIHRTGKALNLGTLYFNAASQHIYERNFEGIKTCIQPEYGTAFEYDQIDPLEFYDEPYRLLDHLYAVAVGRPQDLKSSMLRELAYDNQGFGVRPRRSPNRQPEAYSDSLLSSGGGASR